MTDFNAWLTITVDLLKWRTRVWRVLALITIVLIAAGVWITVVHQSVSAVAVLASLVSVCTIFFCCDALLVYQWQCKLLKSWLSNDLDVAAFKAGIRALRWLPSATLESLLTLIPDSRRETTAGGLTHTEAVALVEALQQQTRRPLFISLIIALCSSALAVVVLLWSL